MTKEIKTKKENGGLLLYGAPWYITLTGCALVIFSAYVGALAVDFASMMVLIIAYGVIFFEIGERLPIWNTYIGGGVLAAFFGTAIIRQLGLIPEAYLEPINEFIGGDSVSFMTIWIIVLITGSVLSLDKKILLKSFVGYFPAILGGLAAAMGFGVLAGLMFGIAPSDIILRYVLPVMGGGNGAGAVPMSEIYQKVTGKPAVSYYAFAIIILTIANIMSIIAGAVLNALGEKFPSLTGDKKTLLRNSEFNVADSDNITPTFGDMCGALMVVFTSYAVGQLFSGFILPEIFGAPIHEYAYMIIFVVILAATGVIPANIRAGAKRLQKFMNVSCAVVMMAGLGFDFDLAELAAACTLSNVVIALFIVLGAIVGSALVGYLVGFYPVDSAITAGLCMANRGGNGDVAVLGASKRMDLMAYAQLSSRLGGGIVLIIASFMFSFL
ncbi:MAG: 2-hydroxycarboxylate transporter family protein [Lachnospiraceae bacterium]